MVGLPPSERETRHDRLDVHAAEEDHHRVGEREGEHDGDARDGDWRGLGQRVEHVRGDGGAVAHVAAKGDEQVQHEREAHLRARGHEATAAEHSLVLGPVRHVCVRPTVVFTTVFMYSYVAGWCNVSRAGGKRL